MIKLLTCAFVLVAVGLAAVQAWRAWQFSADIEALNRQVAEGQTARVVDIGAIPAIVVAFAQRNGGTIGAPATVVAEQSAEMRLAPDQPFFPLRATQLSGTRRPGFVWHARGTMMAVIPIEIVDAYVGDTGLLEARIAGSITVARAIGAGMAKGEAMRFLAELAFNPDAILNAPDLVWATEDESLVTVTLDTPDGPASIRLEFDVAGDIVGIEASDRPRLVGDTSIPTRWVGRFADYAMFGAYRLPRQGEIAWVLPEGEFIYWRGGMTSLKAH